MSTSLQSYVDLPLIDISQFPSEFQYGGLKHLQYHPQIAALTEGCTEWGFFAIVNHGIPVDLFQDLESVVRELFAESEERAPTSNRAKGYFLTPWMESFSMSDLPDSHSYAVPEVSLKIYPTEGNSRDTIQTYLSYMEDLTRRISKIVIASLGLEVDTFYQSDFEQCRASLRVNHYFSDGKSREDEQEVLYGHTDVNCFTILYQDNNGGLQIRSKEGEWMNVKPHSHSLVVNVGDCLK
ncbi:hypothetical protein KI387_005395, partial [Taxus chinensis]